MGWLRPKDAREWWRVLRDSAEVLGWGSVLGQYADKAVRNRHRLRPRRIRLDRMLCSGENGLSAAQYARHTNDPLRPSTAVTRSPQVQLLEEYGRRGEGLFDPEVFRNTAYFMNAEACIAATGSYFDALTAEGIERVARRFVASFVGLDVRDAELGRSKSFSSRHSLPVVTPVRYSSCYQVVDGNHRIAMAVVRGEEAVWAWVKGPPVLTPLQQLVFDVSWTRGRRELYQPIDTPEFQAQWPLVRRCDDRMAMIHDFLFAGGLLPPNLRTSLDVASSYGWFVRAFSERGFEASGVEIDWASTEIGRVAYGLAPGQVTRSEVVRFLEGELERRWDVVTCFSLIHHFVLGRMRISPEEMLGHLDRITGTVLFLDTGQEHELWLRRSLDGWHADRIEQWIRENSSFGVVRRLGVDGDGVGAYAGNYGRTLFACMREE